MMAQADLLTRVGKSPVLLPAVTLALHTGMRKAEILGLTWDRVDFARGVLRLKQTKSGRRREVPMNPAVYDALQPLYRGRARRAAAGDARRASHGAGGTGFPETDGRRVGEYPDGLRRCLASRQGRRLPLP